MIIERIVADIAEIVRMVHQEVPLIDTHGERRGSAMILADHFEFKFHRVNWEGAPHQLQS